MFYFLFSELLVIGTGRKMEMIDPSIREAAKKAGIALEVLDSV